MAYVIETRTPETEERAAAPWHSDGIGDPDGTGEIRCATVEAAEEEIAQLRELWPDYEYRWREIV